jgi:hypothetical protein
VKHEPKKLDIEAAFRGATQPGKAAALENGRRFLKPLNGRTKTGLLGNLLLALFSLVTAGISFVAVFKLMGGSPRFCTALLERLP